VTRRFVLVTLCLTATIAFLIGLVVAGSMSPQFAIAAPSAPQIPVRARLSAGISPAVVSFADVAERLNPAVVNIDATSREEIHSLGRLPRGAPCFVAAPIARTVDRLKLFKLEPLGPSIVVKRTAV